MPRAEFVHLHQHTDFSLLDSICGIEPLLNKARDLHFPALAITDHGNLYGAIDFYKTARERGVKPIIGCEAYIAPGDRREKKAATLKEASFHLVLLAKDEVGYQNLVKIISAAHLDGFYYKPRIDKEILAQHSQGLIGLSACLKGEINFRLQHGQLAEARKAVADYKAIFAPGDFYLELQNHGVELQKTVNVQLLAFAKEFGLPLVATNDVHYLRPEHAKPHDIIICLQTQSNISDPNRMRYPSEQFFFKSPEEMAKLFADHPVALRNTMEIAEKCNLSLTFGKIRYPDYRPPDGLSRENYLRKLCADGLRVRFGIELDKPTSTPEHRAIIERMEFELRIIEKTGFVSYFLIVWDFIHYARTRGISVGPGRGSGAGSIVAYLIGITDIDPMRYGLLFERFLNPERVSPPDFDIDFDYYRRGEVIDYVRKKYGEECVAQIITFGTLGAKMVVRDVGRVLGLSYGEADRIAKMIPPDLNMTLDRALEMSAELKAAYRNEPQTKQVLDSGKVLEGLARNASTHAAGVVISDRPLTEMVPLTRGSNQEIVTQYSMNPLGELGLLKMDFLGLKTLTVIDEALRIVEQTKHKKLTVHDFPLDDSKTFELLGKANTIGIFQLESSGMRDLCRNFGIERFEHIIALIALFRPGPMEWIPHFIARKTGKEKIEYDHPLLEPIARETYGILVYQEQVMQAASALAGFSLGQADVLRRAMGKKKPEEMAKQRESFLKGCHDKNKIPKAKAEKIFEKLESFAGYGFNKSHAAAYAMIAYQTAWLKANYPVEFMSSLMSNELANTDKLQIFLAETREMDIEVLPPDINESGMRFTVVGQNQIRFGLAAIKNVGEVAVESILKTRNDGGRFQSLEEFCERVDSRVVNRKTLESLIKCGAFDFTRKPRKQMFDNIDRVMARTASLQKDRAKGQTSLFGTLDADIAKEEPSEYKTDEWPQNQLLAFEKELLGFYVTGHPLTQYASTLQRYELKSTGHLTELRDGATTRLGGIITKFQPRTTKKGDAMAILSVEDLDGAVEVLVFPETYLRCSEYLAVDRAIFVSGKVDLREDKPKLVAADIFPLADVANRFTKEVHVRLSAATAKPDHLTRVREIIGRHSGRCPLLLCIRYPSGEIVFLNTDQEFRVSPTEALIHELEALLGEKSVYLKIDHSTPSQVRRRPEGHPARAPQPANPF